MDGPAAAVKKSSRVRRSVTDERNLATEDEIDQEIAAGMPSKAKKRNLEAGGADGRKKRKLSEKGQY